MDLTPWLDQLNAHLLAGLFLFVRVGAMLFSMLTLKQVGSVMVRLRCGFASTRRGTGRVGLCLLSATSRFDRLSVTHVYGR